MFFDEIICQVKVDLDMAMAGVALGLRVADLERIPLIFLSGSASAEDRRNPRKLKLECGTGGAFCFDHHTYGVAGEIQESRPACLQVYEAYSPLHPWMRKCLLLVKYISAVDKGKKKPHGRKPGTLSLVGLWSGMMLCTPAKDYAAQFRNTLWLLETALDLEIDPHGSMEKLIVAIPEAKTWADAKNAHEAFMSQVLNQTTYEWIDNGQVLIAYAETSVRGALGYIQGRELPGGRRPDVVICYARNFNGVAGCNKVTIGTLAGDIFCLADYLNKNSDQQGWGGPTKSKAEALLEGMLVCSPVGQSAEIELDDLVSVVKSQVTSDCFGVTTKAGSNITKISDFRKVA